MRRSYIWHELSTHIFTVKIIITRTKCYLRCTQHYFLRPWVIINIFGNLATPCLHPAGHRTYNLAWHSTKLTKYFKIIGFSRVQFITSMQVSVAREVLMKWTQFMDNIEIKSTYISGYRKNMENQYDESIYHLVKWWVGKTNNACEIEAVEDYMI